MNVAECGCPEIEAEDWEIREERWEGRTFYSLPTPMVMHVPIRLQATLDQIRVDIERKGYTIVRPAYPLVKDGILRGAVLLEIEPPANEDPRVVRFGGERIISIVHPGPWKRLGTGVAELTRHTKQKPKAIYCLYAACPQCRQTRGEKAIIYAHYA